MTLAINRLNLAPFQLEGRARSPRPMFVLREHARNAIHLACGRFEDIPIPSLWQRWLVFRFLGSICMPPLLVESSESVGWFNLDGGTGQPASLF